MFAREKEKIKKQVLGARFWGLGRTAKTEERMRRGLEVYPPKPLAQVGAARTKEQVRGCTNVDWFLKSEEGQEKQIYKYKIEITVNSKL